MGEILPWHRFLPHREREAKRGAIPVNLMFDLVLEVLVLTYYPCLRNPRYDEVNAPTTTKMHPLWNNYFHLKHYHQTCAAQLPHLHDVAILSRVEDMMHHDKVMPLRLGLVPKTSRHVSTVQETRGYAYTSPCL